MSAPPEAYQPYEKFKRLSEEALRDRLEQLSEQPTKTGTKYRCNRCDVELPIEELRVPTRVAGSEYVLLLCKACQEEFMLWKRIGRGKKPGEPGFSSKSPKGLRPQASLKPEIPRLRLP